MKKVLVIDDVEVSRYTYKLFLDELELEMLEAEDGESAMSVLNSQRVDAVLLDWHLKKLSGLDLIEKIKASTGGGSAPIIVISGVESSEKAGEAKEAGARTFIEKPTTKEKLQSALKECGVL